MQAAQQQKKYMYECPSCKSRFFSEPVTLGVRDGRLTRGPPICDKCFKSCSCGQRQPYEEYCQVCGDPRKRINLIRHEIDPDDPTFGITSTGSATYPTTTIGDGSPFAYNCGANILGGDPYTLSVPGTIISMSFYCRVSSNVKVGIYDDDGGVPHNLVAGPYTVTGATASATNTVTASPAVFLAAGPYWLTGQVQTAGGIAYTVTGPTQRYKTLNYGDAWPNPIGTTLDGGTVTYSLYATYVRVKGYIKCTKATLSEAATSVTSMSFYSHATGNFRAAIYTDSSGPAVLKWESGSVAASAAAWTTTNISTGTPTTLTLAAGDYWLAWQWDSVNAGPSYAAGGANTGAYLAQAYGAFPDSLADETLSTENWSLYVTYIGLVLSGVTRDSAGNILGGCTVWLFKTSDKSYVDSTTSDPTTGAYSFNLPSDTAYFVRAFKDGSPNVFGTTDDDLVGA